MRRFMVISIPIVTLIIFILVMQSGFIFKKPFGQEEGIPESLEILMEYIKNEKWDDAGKKVETLASLWQKIIFRVQFSAERDEINFFSSNLARLEGAIIARDKSAALIELKEANEHWNDLAK